MQKGIQPQKVVVKLWLNKMASTVTHIFYTTLRTPGAKHAYCLAENYLNSTNNLHLLPPFESALAAALSTCALGEEAFKLHDALEHVSCAQALVVHAQRVVGLVGSLLDEEKVEAIKVTGVNNVDLTLTIEEREMCVRTNQELLQQIQVTIQIDF